MGERFWLAARWQEEANERLRLAKEAGDLEREHRQVSQSVLDLTHDLAASLRERELLKTRTLTPAQLREKARAEWLEFRGTGGKAPEKRKGREHTRMNAMPRMTAIKTRTRAALGMTMISVFDGRLSTFQRRPRSIASII